MSSLQGRVALVTGSSRGIGTAIATLFAREGAKVVVHGRDTAAMSAVTAGIRQAGGYAMQVTGDATRLADLEAMRGRVEQEFGPVDLLVANAGGSPTRPGPVEQTSADNAAWITGIVLDVAGGAVMV